MNDIFKNYIKKNGVNVDEVTLTNKGFSILCKDQKVVDEVCNLFKSVCDKFEIEHLNDEYDQKERWFDKFLINIPLSIAN